MNIYLSSVIVCKFLFQNFFCPKSIKINRKISKTLNHKELNHLIHSPEILKSQKHKKKIDYKILQIEFNYTFCSANQFFFLCHIPHRYVKKNKLTSFFSYRAGTSLNWVKSWAKARNLTYLRPADWYERVTEPRTEYHMIGVKSPTKNVLTDSVLL